jgi:lauroyl/myristoyl acyltransferase
MLRTIRRRAFRRIVRMLARIAPRWPDVALRVCDALAPLVFAPLSRKRVHEVFPHLATETLDQLIVHGRRTAMRNFMLAESIRLYDYPALRKVCVPNDALRSLPAPLILGTFHLGALPAIGAGLEILPAKVLVVRSTPKVANVHDNLIVEITRGDEQHRARLFHRGIQFLREGKYVFLPLDPEESTRVAAPFRGRTMQLARGPFAMSRITNTPILPIVARWNGLKIEFVIGDVIPAGEEDVTAAAATAWLERYLDEHPLDISPRVLELTS